MDDNNEQHNDEYDVRISTAADRRGDYKTTGLCFRCRALKAESRTCSEQTCQFRAEHYESLPGIGVVFLRRGVSGIAKGAVAAKPGCQLALDDAPQVTCARMGMNGGG